MNSDPDDLLDRLSALSRAADVPEDVWTGVAARRKVDRTVAPPRGRAHLSRRARVALQAAAALLVFAGGFLAGQRSGIAPGAPPLPLPARHTDPLAPAIDVQRAGSEYVAALASLTRQADPACRAQGREAALSTLYGAACELSKLDGEDPAQLLGSVAAAREPSEAREVRVVRF